MLNLIRSSLAKPWPVLVSLLYLFFALPSEAYCAGNNIPPHKPCETCTINGGTTAIQGQAGIFTLTGGTTAGWTVSNGATIIRSTSNSVTVQFNNTGTTNIETAGATCGGASINVSVTTQPLTSGGINNPSQTINFGATPALISANGGQGGSCSGSYTYQWYSSTNGSSYSPISGATGVSYQPGALTTTTWFEQAVTCAGTTVFSSPATVTVLPQLLGGSISPSTQTINYNTTPSTLTLSGVSGGNGTYTYQWQSSSNSSFSSITNVGSGTTTYSPTALGSTTYYRVAVTSNGVTSYSSTAVVNVYAQLLGGSISPSTQTINYNTTPSTLTLSGVSGGSGSYTYQWQSSSTSSFSSITNVGSGTTTYTPAALGSTTYYRVAVTSNGVTVYSSTATVTVYPQLSGGVVNTPLQQIYYNTTPSTLTLSSVTGGNGTYSYQWISSSTPAFTTFADVGTNSTSYSPPALTASTYYRVIVTSNGATANSTSATVLVYAQLQSGTVTPPSQSINYNTAPSSLTVSAPSGSDGTYTYQWQSSTDNSTWGNISGQTSTGYSPPALTATTYYRVVTTDNGVSVNSASATVTVYPQLQPGTISPGSQSISYNATPATLTVSGVSGGNGSYTYQWQSSTDDATWSNVGASSFTYSPGNLTANTYYRVIVTSNGVSANSSQVEITVTPAPLSGGTISGPSGTIGYNNSPGAFGSTQPATGGTCGSYTYQWQYSLNGSTWNNIAGATGATYSSPSLTASIYFRRQVSCSGTTATSNTLYIQVTPKGQQSNCTIN